MGGSCTTRQKQLANTVRTCAKWQRTPNLQVPNRTSSNSLHLKTVHEEEQSREVLFVWLLGECNITYRLNNLRPSWNWPLFLQGQTAKRHPQLGYAGSRLKHGASRMLALLSSLPPGWVRDFQTVCWEASVAPSVMAEGLPNVTNVIRYQSFLCSKPLTGSVLQTGPRVCVKPCKAHQGSWACMWQHGPESSAM